MNSTATKASLRQQVYRYLDSLGAEKGCKSYWQYDRFKNIVADRFIDEGSYHALVKLVADYMGI